MIGTLLQAGWHSKVKIKETGIIQSLKYAPIIRKKINDITEKSTKHIPKIISDFIILAHGKESFRSNFLAESLKKLFNEEIQSEIPDLDVILITLWVLTPLLDDQEYQSFTEKTLNILSSNYGYEIEEKIRTLIMLTIQSRKDNEIDRIIKKKTKKMIRNNNFIAKKLLPEYKKGFRPGHS